MSSSLGIGMRVESPCRADLAGGTLDIWPLGIMHPGSLTVNAAIPVMVQLDVDVEGPTGEVWHAVGEDNWRRLGAGDASTDLTAAVALAVRPEGGVRVRVQSQAGVGSGLGGSSAYAVALARGILTAAGEEMENVRLVALARDLEARILRVPTGVQDHWAAVRGGILAVHYEPGGERVERLDVELEWVGDRMTVFDTGISHHSGMVNWEVIRRRLDGDSATAAALEAIAEAARRCRRALLDGDDEEVGKAVAAEWSARGRLAPEVCPPELAEIERVAVGAGAAAIKACGAGGGGSVFIWHRAGARDAITRALADAVPGGRVVACEVARIGCRVLART